MKRSTEVRLGPTGTKVFLLWVLVSGVNLIVDIVRWLV